MSSIEHRIDMLENILDSRLENKKIDPETSSLMYRMITIFREIDKKLEMIEWREDHD